MSRRWGPLVISLLAALPGAYAIPGHDGVSADPFASERSRPQVIVFPSDPLTQRSWNQGQWTAGDPCVEVALGHSLENGTLNLFALNGESARHRVLRFAFGGETQARANPAGWYEGTRQLRSDGQMTTGFSFGLQPGNYTLVTVEGVDYSGRTCYRSFRIDNQYSRAALQRVDGNASIEMARSQQQPYDQPAQPQQPYPNFAGNSCVAAINNARARAGLWALIPDPNLENIAATNNANGGGHVFTGGSPQIWSSTWDPNWSVSMWTNSGAHANIMFGGYRYVGCSMAGNGTTANFR